MTNYIPDKYFIPKPLNEKFSDRQLDTFINLQEREVRSAKRLNRSYEADKHVAEQLEFLAKLFKERSNKRMNLSTELCPHCENDCPTFILNDHLRDLACSAYIKESLEKLLVEES